VFGFGRKKKPEGTARTFVEATGGGWGETPDVVAGNGGENADFVGEVLKRASEYAKEKGVTIGEEFTFTISDIPVGISSPHEIIMGLMMRAHEHGLSVDSAINESVYFTRLK
jgi:hypothetical protein